MTDDQEARRVAAAALGRAKSEKKTEAVRKNAKQPRRKRGPMPEETKAKIRATRAAHLAQIRAAGGDGKQEGGEGQ